jgi:hypothetical protein
MELEIVKLSEISQNQKDKYVFSPLQNLDFYKKTCKYEGD